jgi:hypothetical protein
MKANYILTTFSPTMFGNAISLYMKTITEDEAKSHVDDSTQIVASRESHSNMAARLFGQRNSIRHADLGPDRSAILIHYRGKPVCDSGIIPPDAVITYYLLETEEYTE